MGVGPGVDVDMPVMPAASQQTMGDQEDRHQPRDQPPLHPCPHCSGITPPSATAEPPNRVAYWKPRRDRKFGQLQFRLALESLEWTGRQVQVGKVGRSPAENPRILKPLGVAGAGWLQQVASVHTKQKAPAQRASHFPSPARSTDCSSSRRPKSVRDTSGVWRGP
jgi:hypothetical protein